MNRRSIRTRFTIRFLRSLRNLSSQKSVERRCQMIKLTANASMASAVGPQRVWSRAVLLKLRWRSRTIRSFHGKKKKKKKKMKVNNNGGGQEEELRKLVPGGEVMDTSMLLDETAHYIKCLTDQVMVMRSLVHNGSV